ncbi:MAG: glycosyltransferase family 2 protein, partial [Candidatus Nanohaloarchaea archaeon]|nr:glycosyltransferase family 2 protein [Candidatus Nanohaloarchaea archaeon]
PQPDGWIESLAYYEKVVFQFGRNLQRLFGFTDASSSMVVMERETLERLGGYSDDTLTEDVDFTHTCYREGVTVRDTYRFPARSEAAHTLRDLWGQRKRWVKGRLMVAKKEITSFLLSPSIRSFVSMFMAVSSVAGSLFMLTLVSKFLVLFLLGAQVFYTTPLVVFLTAVVLTRLVDTWQGHVDRVGPDWIAAPFILPFYSLITAKSVFEYVFDSDPVWYQVEKSA